ncbi:MAG: GNAT family N-acetyltransferase [Candidatus Pelagadaptatus aseana]|uniref:bifunctional helix-turn-helix transcriptional regulator/GNAT family N-acetyltransferase n=1 Tax=Candidatus Pelagadaptatus aseana TaxID=3120508 RepID=UPI0039B237BD
MKNLNDFNELALGSRLKRLSDQMFQDVDKLYKARGVNLSSRCFSSLILLDSNGAMGITELAQELGQTHSAISQISKTMLKSGVIDQGKDPKDERRRLLNITAEGRRLLQQHRPLMDDIEAALHEAISVTQDNFMTALTGLEQQLGLQSLKARVDQREKDREHQAIEIIDYRPDYRDDFKRLNIEWLEKYFYVEEVDDRVLSNPQQSILDPGGYIFFARLHGEIVGTSALIYKGDGKYELSKMSVTANRQGLGLGRKLAQRAIDHFKKINGETLYLETNKRLTPAIKLYESLGFQHAERDFDSPYQRSDVYMIYR